MMSQRRWSGVLRTKTVLLKSLLLVGAFAILPIHGLLFNKVMAQSPTPTGVRIIQLRGDRIDRRFDGIGVVDGGGATSVLLKDYPEPERSQILDLLYKPKFGASVGALLMEIPGDGNSTQGTMPSHMHTREDLNYHRGYSWWIAQQAKRRNPNLTLAGMAWSAPGWLGNGKFWSTDTVDYYLKWLTGLRNTYGLELTSLGMRNEKGVDFPFAEQMRSALSANGFRDVKVQGFDNWTPTKLDFVKEMIADPEKRNAIDILSAHTLVANPPAAGSEIVRWGSELKKPIWNSEEHIYKTGYDCEISIVQAFNLNYIRYGTSLVVNWYGIAGVYPIEPYSETPAALLARSPWSGHYSVREALWGYAHYGQFAQPGWSYLKDGSGELPGGGTFVSLMAPDGNFSVVVETKGAKGPQTLGFQIGPGLSSGNLHVWRSNAAEQFTRQSDLIPTDGVLTLSLEPDSIYSLTTTTGQQKGSFDDVPKAKPFPFPYRENFDEYAKPKEYGYLPHYTADIDGVFEIAARPDGKGNALHQVISTKPISWAPEWLPYTILGDDQWGDYTVSADVLLDPRDSAGIMGRVTNVGSGYGTVPRGYYFMIDASGQCRVVVVRGKSSKNEIVGDAEQQALLKANRDFGPGGELVLGKATAEHFDATRWHRLKLRFEGQSITASLDGGKIIEVQDSLYGRGMVGLVAGAETSTFSTPYYDNVSIDGLDEKGAGTPQVRRELSPIYAH